MLASLENGFPGARACSEPACRSHRIERKINTLPIASNLIVINAGRLGPITMLSDQDQYAWTGWIEQDRKGWFRDALFLDRTPLGRDAANKRYKTDHN